VKRILTIFAAVILTVSMTMVPLMPIYADDSSAAVSSEAPAETEQTAAADENSAENTADENTVQAESAAENLTANEPAKIRLKKGLESAAQKSTSANKTTEHYEEKTENTTDAVDNNTTLADGTYKPESFAVSGGTGKVRITCSRVTVTSGKAYARIDFSSRFFTELKTNAQIYKPVSGGSSGISSFEVPVDLNSRQTIIGTTTAMSEVHDIIYSVEIVMSEPTDDGSTAAVDNSTTLSDAAYKPDGFTYAGGTGKVSISCSRVTVSGGKSYATIVFSSAYYTKLRASGRIYNASVDKNAGTSTFVIPIKVNTANTVIGTTTAMTESHDVTYVISAVLSNSSKKISESSSPSAGDDSQKNGKKKDLKTGTYAVRSDTDNRMFYIAPNTKNQKLSILKISKNGKITATVTLTGQGYDYLYMGTAADAAKAKTSDLSKYKSKNGYYSYSLPVSGMDTKINVAAHSKKLNKWFQHTIIFYSSGAEKVKDGTEAVSGKNSSNGKSGTQTSFRNDHKADRESKYKDDSGRSTASVNNSTSLSAGVYTPDQFSWSGGSGRLAYIRCDKITVSGGHAYATIVFSSNTYDSLKASGNVYSKTGGGLSKFVIPVKLNANNTIIGRTTAMSQPHWVKYSIYICLNKALPSGGSSSGRAKLKTDSLAASAPAIMGLEYKSTVKVSKAKYFRIFNYKHGIKLIQVDVSKNTSWASGSEKKNASEKKEYDDEGNVLAKTQHEITRELYQKKIVNYLIVPKGTELPAGLQKKCIVIRQPADKTYSASRESLSYIAGLGKTKDVSTLGFKKDKTVYAGKYTALKYRTLIQKKTDLCILPASALPAKIKNTGNIITRKMNVKKQKEKAAAEKKELLTVEERLTALDIPVFIDRSADEKTKSARAEWIKVYGAIYGCQKKAAKIYEDK